MSDTPRTDEEESKFDHSIIPHERHHCVEAEFARELEREIAKLKASFQQSTEARTGWLNEFDGYKLKILELTQRLSEARTLIEMLNNDRDDGVVKRSTKLWLEKIER